MHILESELICIVIATRLLSARAENQSNIVRPDETLLVLTVWTLVTNASLPSPHRGRPFFCYLGKQMRFWWVLCDSLFKLRPAGAFCSQSYLLQVCGRKW